MRPRRGPMRRTAGWLTAGLRCPGSQRRIIAGASAAVVAGLACCSLWLAFRGGGTILDDWITSAVVVAAATAVAAAGGILSESPPRAWPGWIALAGTLALTVLAVASFAWTPSPSLTVNGAALWAFTAAVVGLAVWVCRGGRASLSAVVAVILVSSAVAVAVVARLLAGNEAMFVRDRVAWPFDYPNGVAALLLIGAPSATGLSAALPVRASWRAGLAALAAFLVATGALVGSRGAAIALAVAFIVLILLAPSRPVAVLTIVAILTGPFLALPILLGGSPVDAAKRGAAVIVASAVSGVAGSIVAFNEDRILDAWRRETPRRIATVTALAMVVVVALAVSASTASVTRHLASAHTNRYDYWRVAVEAWRSHPVLGVGAGAYAIPWYRDRTIRESVTDPHGWPFRIGSEQGLVGLALFLAVVAAFVVAAKRVRLMDARRNAAGAAGGASAAYFVTHASVDWLMAIVPVLILGVLSGAALLGSVAPCPERLAGPRCRTTGTLFAVGLLVFIGPIWLSTWYLGRGTADTDPKQALAEIHESERWSPWSIQPIQAEAEVRLEAGDAAGAAQALEKAIEMEPQRWEPWVELSRVQIVRRRMAASRAALHRATILNPLGTDAPRS